jgi:hypothetical protein
MPGLNDILTVILGGGRGTRLWPLTQQRSKPAVPIAGKYRLIDIPISNSINSGIYRIAVLTQYNSVSLHRHISHTYHFDAFHQGLGAVVGSRTNHGNRRLVPGFSGCGSKTAVRNYIGAHQRPADTFRRSSLPHGLRAHGALPLGQRGGYHCWQSNRFRRMMSRAMAFSNALKMAASLDSQKSQKTRPSKGIWSALMIPNGLTWARWVFISSKPNCSLSSSKMSRSKTLELIYCHRHS